MAETTNSGANTSQSDSATGTTQADVAAAARVAAAAAQTAATQAAAAASGTLAQQEAVGDISPTEAYTINLKRLVDVGINLDAALQQVIAASAQRLARNAEDYDQGLRNIAAQALQNAVTIANSVNSNAAITSQAINGSVHSEREETIRVGKVASDRTWNVDEVAELVAKTPVYLDALAAAVAAKLSNNTAAK